MLNLSRSLQSTLHQQYHQQLRCECLRLKTIQSKQSCIYKCLSNCTQEHTEDTTCSHDRILSRSFSSGSGLSLLFSQLSLSYNSKNCYGPLKRHVASATERGKLATGHSGVLPWIGQHPLLKKHMIISTQQASLQSVPLMRVRFLNSVSYPYEVNNGRTATKVVPPDMYDFWFGPAFEDDYEKEEDVEQFEKIVEDEKFDKVFFANLLAMNEKILELKTMINCSESELMHLVELLPRLKYKTCTEKLIQNIGVLFENGYNKEYVHKLLKKHPSSLLQVHAEKLTEIVQNPDFRKPIPKPLLCNEIDRCLLDGHEKNTDLLAELLHVSKYILMCSVNETFIEKLDSKLYAFHLKEKVDYLQTEGIDASEIINSMSILKIPMSKLEQKISQIRFEYGNIDVPFLVSLLSGRGQRVSDKYSRYKSLLHRCGLESSSLTDLQKKFLQDVNITKALTVIEHLNSLGYSSEEIGQCLYIIDKDFEDIKVYFEKEKQSQNDVILKDKMKLLNAVLYKIENRTK